MGFSLLMNEDDEVELEQDEDYLFEVSYLFTAVLVSCRFFSLSWCLLHSQRAFVLRIGLGTGWGVGGEACFVGSAGFIS